MAVVDRADDEHAGPGAHHGGRDARARVELLALETPCDVDWHVTPRNHTGQLCKLSSVNDASSKRERNNAWRL